MSEETPEQTPEDKATPGLSKAESTGPPKETPKQRVTTGIGSTTERVVKPVVKVEDAKGKVGGVTPVTRPTTAGEYAKSTAASADNTSVIPVIKEDTPDPRVPTADAPEASVSSGRQANLKVVRIDPWSVSKVVFALTVALMIVAVVAVTILWIVLSFAGVWDQINSSVSTVLSDNSSSFDITKYLGFGRMVGLTLVISAINVVISTAVATIGAYLYNLSAQLLGGFDLTLAEDD